MMTRSTTLFLVAASVAAVPARVTAQSNPTRGITDRYLELTFHQEYDALTELYAEDAVFFDPTGDVFPGPVAAGPVEGASAIVALQKSWGLAGTEFDIEQAFTVGQYSLYRGSLRVRYDAAAPWIEFPFATVLRVESGRISERTDFGAYVGSFDFGDEVVGETARTGAVAPRYLEAYLAADLEAQRALLAADAVFQDPTAQVYGPNSGQKLESADVILRRRSRTFQNVSDFDLDVARSFVSNHHAVYMGTTKYTLANGSRFEQPAVMVIEVRDGKVTRHWDFVDYSVGPVG